MINPSIQSPDTAGHDSVRGRGKGTSQSMHAWRRIERRECERVEDEEARRKRREEKMSTTTTA